MLAITYSHPFAESELNVYSAFPKQNVSTSISSSLCWSVLGTSLRKGPIETMAYESDWNGNQGETRMVVQFQHQNSSTKELVFSWCVFDAYLFLNCTLMLVTVHLGILYDLFLCPQRDGSAMSYISYVTCHGKHLSMNASGPSQNAASLPPIQTPAHSVELSQFQF